MTTSHEIATRALRRLGVVRPDESPSAEDQKSAEDVLAEIMAELVADGVIYPETEYPLDARFQSSVIALLALRLTDEFGQTPSPQLQSDARKAEGRLSAAYFVPPTSTFDAALVTAPINGQRLVSTYGDGEVVSLSQWRASTAYAIGTEVMSGDRIYRALTSGTSGSIAPTGTESDILDGAVTWSFVRMAG